eukprot:1159839-Pelagomonas_calceolata.AAC.24
MPPAASIGSELEAVTHTHMHYESQPSYDFLHPMAHTYTHKQVDTRACAHFAGRCQEPTQANRLSSIRTLYNR